MDRRRRRSWKPLAWALGVMAALAGWSTLLWPPVQYYYDRSGATLIGTIGALLRPTNDIYDDGVLVGYLFILSSLLLAFAVPITLVRLLGLIARYVERSEADVSLLQLSLTLRFGPMLEECTIVREQLFHANQPGTSAYHYNQSVETDGATIDPTSFEMNSRIANARITSDYIVSSQPKRFEAIEVFKQPLPTSWLATYLPDWIVLFLYEHTSLLDRAIVERVGEITIRGDHNGDRPMFELHSPKRRARNITITLDFPVKVAPKPTDVKCFIIRDNVVSDIYPRCTPDGDRRVYTAFVSELDHEKIRLQWDNGRLRALQHADAGDDGTPDGVAPQATRAEPTGWRRLVRGLGSKAGTAVAETKGEA